MIHLLVLVTLTTSATFFGGNKEIKVEEKQFKDRLESIQVELVGSKTAKKPL